VLRDRADGDVEGRPQDQDAAVWYPRLLRATPQQRSNYQPSPFGIHWPEIDEDLSVAGMLRGAKAPGAKQPELA
jgi:uncharacterized protein DUF2442